MGPFILAIVLLVLGVFAIIYPDAMQGQEAGGRRAWLKALVAWLWGRPAGIMAACIGALLLINAVRGLKGGAAAPAE
ncbi:MAG: hypothetical protein ACRD2T_11180 [Thermoanaerobaculia bacterium]